MVYGAGWMGETLQTVFMNSAVPSLQSDSWLVPAAWSPPVLGWGCPFKYSEWHRDRVQPLPPATVVNFGLYPKYHLWWRRGEEGQ